jgi:hypothetical protein
LLEKLPTYGDKLHQILKVFNVSENTAVAIFRVNMYLSVVLATLCRAGSGQRVGSNGADWQSGAGQLSTFKAANSQKPKFYIEIQPQNPRTRKRYISLM